MDGLWSQLALVGVLVLLNAAFAGSEIALISLREGQLRRLERKSKAGRILGRLTADPNRFLATIQIGITLAGFLASATAAVTLAEPLVEPLSFLGSIARPAAIFLVTLALTFVMLVLGELAPKRIALQRAEPWALAVARPLSLLGTVTRPVVWLLGKSTDLVVRALGVDPSETRGEVSEEELRDLVATQPELSEEERDIISGAFEFADRMVRDVMIPRPSVVGLPVDMPAEEAVQVLLTHAHSRAPAHRDNLDAVVGTVHLRNLLSGGGTVGDHVQPALLLPETVGCLDALQRMQAARQQMAIVISEHGGTEGIITVEDLLEELVGEIWDEGDPDIQMVRRNPDGSLTVAGSFPIHDLPDIGVELPSGEYSTIAGLILERLGYLPAVGETLTVEGWQLRVAKATDRSITSVVLTPLDDSEMRAED